MIRTEPESTTHRNSAQIARSRGIGSFVGTLIGAGWMAYGLAAFGQDVRAVVGLSAVIIAGWLLGRSRQLLAVSRSLPAPDEAQRAASRRVWRWFWVNFAVEIVLLNVAVNLLAAPALRVYWIPAISIVVGLHFLPMAVFFGVQSYRVCGGLMILAAMALIVRLRASSDHAAELVGGEAVVNACVLWGTAAWGLRHVARPGADSGRLPN